jgi:hypothetical protein
LVLGDKYGSEAKVAAYPKGQVVPVYYNSSKPKDSILEKSTTSTLILWMIVDLMSCIGILVIAACASP